MKTARADVTTTRLTAPNVDAGTKEDGKARSKSRGRAGYRPFRVPAPELRSWLDQVIIPILVKAAPFLRVHYKTLEGMARTGTIPATKQGRSWVFRLSRLNDWINQEIDSKGAHKRTNGSECRN